MTEQLMVGSMIYVLIPIWIVLGFIDWLCHWQAEIAIHCGPWESLMHLALLGLAGTGLLAGLLLEINSPVWLLIVASFIVHESVTWVDVTFANWRRVVSPTEQRVHDYMTAIAFSLVLLVTLLHWDDVVAIWRNPSVLLQPWHLKEPPLPVPVVMSILGGVFAFNMIPYLVELYAGLKRFQS